MSVVKNMIVRVGADMSGLASGFKKGGAATKSFTKMAAAEIRTLASEVSQMESVYATVVKATERMNLGTPVSKQIAALEKDKAKLMAEAEKAAASVAHWADIEPLGAQFKTDEASKELENLDLQIRNVTERIKELQDVADLGKELGLGDISSKTLTDLRKSISDARTKMTQLAASTSGSNLNVENLLKSFRRLGLASIGLRFVRSIFGELSSIVRQYIGENETLQAQVNGLKSAMGQALAPAINIVTNAMAALMPYVVGVSNAIGSLLQALGGGWATVAAEANGATKAIKGAGGAQKDLNRSLQGFDEITKLNSKSGGGGGGGSNSGSTVKVEPITPQWLQDFVDDLIVEIQEQDWAGVGTVVVQGLSSGIGAAGGLIVKVGVKLFDSVVESFNKRVDKWVEEGAPDRGLAVGMAVIEGICEPFQNAPVWIRENIWLPLEYGFNSTFYGKEIADVKLGLKDDTATWKRKVMDWWQRNPPRDLPIAATVTDNSVQWFKVLRDMWKNRSGKEGSVGTFSVSPKDESTAWVDFVVKKWYAALNNAALQFPVEPADNGPEWAQSAAENWKNGLPSARFDSFHVDIANDAASWVGDAQKYLDAEGKKLKMTAKLEVKVPTINVTWDKEVGPGGTVHIPNYNVQWNAKGLIMSGAQLFGRVGKTLLGGGEAGREALLPLDRHTSWMDDIADRVALRVDGGGMAGQDITVNLVLDGKIVTSTVVRNINAQARATGRNPLAAYM